MALTPGKWRRLGQTATRKGVFVVLALDHRGNLQRAINPAGPALVSVEMIRDIKRDVAAALSPASSAILLDPETGAGEFIADIIIPSQTGLIMTLDATGYAGDPSERVTRILEGWSVEQISRLGAAGVKLLLYYHPDAPNAPDQRGLVERVAEACLTADLPFFLEPLSYSLDPQGGKLSSEEKQAVVTETARQLSPLGVDILKVEFPLDVKVEQDRTEWRQACVDLNEASVVPWILLSAGVDFDTYYQQVAVACESGASGVMAGRAIWKEATTLPAAERREFLSTTALERMRRISALCADRAHPFTERLSALPLPFDWYRLY